MQRATALQLRLKLILIRLLPVHTAELSSVLRQMLLIIMLNAITTQKLKLQIILTKTVMQ